MNKVYILHMVNLNTGVSYYEYYNKISEAISIFRIYYEKIKSKLKKKGVFEIKKTYKKNERIAYFYINDWLCTIYSQTIGMNTDIFKEINQIGDKQCL